MNENDKNYVEPDISVICDTDKLNDKGCNGAPDWIIEIVSPGSRRMDYSVKLFKYRSAGVREYWIVDPEKHRITVHDLIKVSMNILFPASSKPESMKTCLLTFHNLISNPPPRIHLWGFCGVFLLSHHSFFPLVSRYFGLPFCLPAQQKNPHKMRSAPTPVPGQLL